MTVPQNFLLVNREDLGSPGEALSIAKDLWAVMSPERLIRLQEKHLLNYPGAILAYVKDL